ncbi:hypothetical protein STEG23_003047, partial [Scotinomys teguina]
MLLLGPEWYKCFTFTYIYLCTPCMPGACKDQKRALDPLELELQMIVLGSDSYGTIIVNRAAFASSMPGRNGDSSEPCASSGPH